MGAKQSQIGRADFQTVFVREEVKRKGRRERYEGRKMLGVDHPIRLEGVLKRGRTCWGKSQHGEKKKKPEPFPITGQTSQGKS